MKDPRLSVLRELARCYQAFEQLSAAHIRELGLTPPQFDIIATLGNTPGMTCKELGEKTLITKGTLTGVVDRLLAKGLVTREASDADRRQVRIALTAAGDRLFQKVFPEHVSYIAKAWDRVPMADLMELKARMEQLRLAFEAAFAASQASRNSDDDEEEGACRQ